MKPLVIALMFTLLTGCQTRSTNAVYPVETQAALIFENGLAYDGCAERIQLLSDSLLYVPTQATLPVLQKALSDIPPNPNTHLRTVTIRYVRTGQPTILYCGWGSKQEVPELKVLAITKP